MQLYVAHKDEAGSSSRHFAMERPDLQNIDLFSNFYFWLDNVEVKYYDLEKREDYIECHIDVMVDGTWKTITTKNNKRKYALKNLSKLTSDSHITWHKTKGIAYLLISYAELNNAMMISKFASENKNNLSRTEEELTRQYA